MTWILTALLLAWLAWGPWVLAAAAAALCVPRLRWWVVDRVHLTRRRTAIGLGAVALASAIVVVVPDGWLPIPPAPGALASPSYLGRPADAHPVAAEEVPRNPHLARNGAGSTQDDAAASGAYSWAGPLGNQPDVETAWFGLQHCATSAFDSRGRVVALCDGLSGPSLRVLDPDSMRVRASLDLTSPEEGPSGPEDLCRAGDFYLDDQDRAMLATTDRRVVSVRTADGQGDPGLAADVSWDLTPYVPPADCLVALLPDWSGRIWWASHGGLVGTLAPHSGDVAVHDLGAGIVSSFAADEAGGVYVVTDEALHRLAAGPDGSPRVTWRTPYDRGEDEKPGQRSRGSGTTPTLLDGGLVAIADNADPRMNVVFLDRGTGEEVCRQEVFDEGASATGSSLVSLGSGVVVENNHGYRGPLSTMLGFATSPGLARVDVREGRCSLAWTSDEIAPSAVAKVSWATGLLYTYTKRPTWTGVSAWYVTALDVRTGRTMWSLRTGTGTLLNNDRAAISLAPDGALWVATMGGLVRVRDRS